MKKIYKIFLIILVFFCCGSVCAEDGSSAIPISGLKAGDIIEVYISPDGIENLYSYSCRLVYDPELIKFTGVEDLMFGKHKKSGVMSYNTSRKYEYDGQLTGYSRYLNKPGQLYYVITRLGTQSKALNKNLSKITFTALKDTDAEITIENGNIVMFDSDAPVKNEINTDECFTSANDSELKYKINVK